MTQYSYILAPHTEKNYELLLKAISDFPDLVRKKRVGKAYERRNDDVLDIDGQLVINASQQQYMYIKVDSSLLTPDLLDNIEELKIYTIETQPHYEFWLNV